MLWVCAESPKCSSQLYLECEHFKNDHTLWIFVALVIIRVKQKNSSAVESKVYPSLGSALDQ